MLTRCRSFLVSKFLVSKFFGVEVLVSKFFGVEIFWWQNLSFVENFGDKICLHGIHEWSKSNTSLSLMQSRMLKAECSMNTSWRSENIPLWICWWFLTEFWWVLTSWFHFWHYGFIFDMCKLQVIAHVMFIVFFLSFIFVVRDFISDFIYDFISDFIYDFINCQSCLRLHCTNVGYI